MTPAQSTAFQKRQRSTISHLRRPSHLGLEEWQTLLRAQIGRQILRERFLRIKKIGPEAVFSTYEVLNRQTRRTYRVAIRGEALGLNPPHFPNRKRAHDRR